MFRSAPCTIEQGEVDGLNEKPKVTQLRPKHTLHPPINLTTNASQAHLQSPVTINLDDSEYRHVP